MYYYRVIERGANLYNVYNSDDDDYAHDCVKPIITSCTKEEVSYWLAYFNDVPHPEKVTLIDGWRYLVNDRLLPFNKKNDGFKVANRKYIKRSITIYAVSQVYKY